MYLEVGSGDEDSLIGRCLSGDAAAFQPLVERYYDPLFRVAARMLHDREDARDATQTAFLKAYQGLSTLDRARPFFSWIYRILVNDCLNRLRARRPMDTLDHVDERPAPVTDGVEAGETQHQVRAALLKLTPEQREVVMLRHFGAMSYAEMAAALGIPVKTVKSRLFSGRQRLCDLLAAAKG